MKIFSKKRVSIEMSDIQNESIESTPEDYQQYRGLGGIINEKDYRDTLLKAKNITELNKSLILQSEIIAGVAGITLHNTNDTLDQRTVLYGVLRADTNPGKKEYHHSQMDDQRLFAEALRMVGDTDSLGKLIKTHPNISFN